MTATQLSLVEQSTATLSPCSRYRYRLGRRWRPGGTVVFVMLNPSTADAVDTDPTITRCVGFAHRWGHGAIDVVNLFAWRETHPRALAGVEDLVGPDNDAAIVEATAVADAVVLAWGSLLKLPASVRRLARERAAVVRHQLVGRVASHLGLTADGEPRHPLFVRGDQAPTRWIQP